MKGVMAGGWGAGHPFQAGTHVHDRMNCCAHADQKRARLLTFDSALQVVYGRQPESMPSVAKRSPPSNDVRVGAQLSTIPEADDDMTNGGIDSGIMADAATVAASANQGEVQNAALLSETRLPLPEDVQRAEAFQVHQLLLT